MLIDRLRGMFKEEDEKLFLNIKPSELALKLAEKYGYKPYIVERMYNVLGSTEEVVDLLEWNEVPMPETVRCNDYLISCARLYQSLSQKGFKLSIIPWLPHGIEVIEAPFSVGASHEYLKGYYYIQDPGSMLPVYIMEPREGELIVDMAAAPGGKATQILQLTRDRALLVASDISRRRMKALRSHMQRMGFKSYIALRTDSRKLPRLVGTGVADKVLLDAPSSGEGIIRKDPNRKVSRDPQDLMEVHYLQLSLLLTALEIASPEGIIVYAACSTSPEEGELVVDRLLRLKGDTVEVETTFWEGIGSKGVTEYMGINFDSSVSRCLRLWPHRDGTEGFFICRLRKVK
ncbi:MAG: RsmB/NOP family class I SAM-dependent RNA methyltransferase [Desulfurococcales archaeon]|nr:RsmB/NOP family class I SAM-dependent RNA methyltransferase [Desulfurococcales archaeon]